MTTTQEWLDWLNQPHDAIGECDRCQAGGKLYRLPLELDNEPDAGWLYCPACFRNIVERAQ